MFANYKPISYTHASVLAMPHYADVDLLSQPKSKRQVLAFNSLDKECNINRCSYMGDYQVQDGLAL